MTSAEQAVVGSALLDSTKGLPELLGLPEAAWATAEGRAVRRAAGEIGNAELEIAYVVREGEADEPPEAAPDESATGQPDRLRALLEANAGRLARRAIKGGVTDAAVIAEALAVNLETAAHIRPAIAMLRKTMDEQQLAAAIFEIVKES